jgi:ribosomal protein L31E
VTKKYEKMRTEKKKVTENLSKQIWKKRVTKKYEKLRTEKKREEVIENLRYREDKRLSK